MTLPEKAEGRAGQSPPLISVVALTFNRRDKLRRCLNSIFSNSYPRTEVIVVDDASEDGTDAMVSHEFPLVRLIRHVTPTLTAKGINDGLTASSGEFVVIVDDDNIFHEDCLGQFVSTFQSDREIGVVGPICYYLEAPDIIMYAGARLSRFARRTVFVAADEKDNGQFQDSLLVDMFPNCFCIRRSLLPRIGLVRAYKLPFFNDDASLQLAVARLGFKVVLNPRAKIWHDFPMGEGERRTQTSPLRLYYNVRSKIFLERGYDTRAGLITFIISYPAYFFHHLVTVLTSPVDSKKRRVLLATLLEAITDGILGRGGAKYI